MSILYPQEDDVLIGLVIGFLFGLLMSTCIIGILLYDIEVIETKKLIDSGLAHYDKYSGDLEIHLNNQRKVRGDYNEGINR